MRFVLKREECVSKWNSIRERERVIMPPTLRQINRQLFYLHTHQHTLLTVHVCITVNCCENTIIVAILSHLFCAVINRKTKQTKIAWIVKIPKILKHFHLTIVEKAYKQKRKRKYFPFFCGEFVLICINRGESSALFNINELPTSTRSPQKICLNQQTYSKSLNIPLKV